MASQGYAKATPDNKTTSGGYATPELRNHGWLCQTKDMRLTTKGFEQ